MRATPQSSLFVGQESFGSPPPRIRRRSSRAALRPDTFVQLSVFTGAEIHGWPFAGLELQAYDFIMADPPWEFELDSEKGNLKSPSRHYDTMPLAEVKAMPVGLLAKNDAILFLWATWPMLRQALEVVDAWGFRYVTGGSWDKQRMGPGYVVRTRCEPWLLATTGSFDHSKACQNFFSEARRQNSRKPEAAYAWAERYMPAARRADLFSRKSRRGWDAWGNEAGKFDQEKGMADEHRHQQGRPDGCAFADRRVRGGASGDCEGDRRDRGAVQRTHQGDPG